MTYTHIKNLSNELGNGFDNFEGGISIVELFKHDRLKEVVAANGIYVVVLKQTDPQVRFLSHDEVSYRHCPKIKVKYKSVDLESRWTREAEILYIGKADHKKGGGLRKRIRSLVRFAYGEAKSHTGGRSLWHLTTDNDDPDHHLWEDLRVYWKSDGITNPGNAEYRAIRHFKSKHSGKRPFANMADGSECL